MIGRLGHHYFLEKGGMAKFLAAVRAHVYPRSAIEQWLEAADLRASRAIWGMVAVIGATLLVAHGVMIIAGV